MEQVNGHWRIDTRNEAVSFIERLRKLIFCVHQKRVRANKAAGVQST